MNTDQARRLITLHDNADRALANLRNAGAMSSDDPRAAEMLESAGDAYAEATEALAEYQARTWNARGRKRLACLSPNAPSDAPSGPESTSEAPASAPSK